MWATGISAEFEGRGRNNLAVFADVMKELYSLYHRYSRLNAVTAKVVPQQRLLNSVSPRCAPCREHKQQRSLNFIILWMLQSLLWCLENPKRNAQWNFNGRYAPVMSICNCFVKPTSQKFVCKYRHEIISAYSIQNRKLKKKKPQQKVQIKIR